MVFTILNGNCFFQWDKNRKVVVHDDTITEVHFCNRLDNLALMCEVYECNGIRIADVPNKLLTESWDIKVYGSDGNYTRHYETFKVVARTKPTDYVYEETEVFTYRQLEKRLIEIETAGFKKDVEEYFESHPVAVSVNGQTGEVVLNADDVRAISIDNKASYDDAVTKAHTHANKSALDKVTDAKISSWDNKSNFDGDYNSLTNKPDLLQLDNTLTSSTKAANAKTVGDKIKTIETNANNKANLTGYTANQNVVTDASGKLVTKSPLPYVDDDGVLCFW